MSGNADTANVSSAEACATTGMDRCIHSLSLKRKPFSYSGTQKVKEARDV